MSDFVERRAARRLDLHIPSKVLAHPHTGEPISCQTTLENVSFKGAYFYLKDSLLPETRVELEIDLPKSVPSSTNLQLNLKGVVVRLDEPSAHPGLHGVAVKFDGEWNVESVFAN